MLKPRLGSGADKIQNVMQMAKGISRLIMQLLGNAMH
jgi:hypothetical protein